TERPLTQRILSHIRRAKENEYRGSNSPLYKSICPLIYAIRVFGLAPYEFEDNKLVPSNSYLSFTFFWFCVYTYVIWRYLVGVLDPSTDMKTTLYHTEFAKTTGNYFVVITDFIICISTRKEISWIWNKIEDFDQAMRDLGYARKEKETRVVVWFIIGFNIVIWGIINNLGMAAFHETFLHNVSYLTVYVGAAVTVTKFSGLVLILGQRFKQLNEIAKSHVSKSRWIHVDPIIDDELVDCLHSELTAVGIKLNNVYRWSLILWLGNLSFHSVSSSYFVFDWVMDGKFHIDFINCLLGWFVAVFSQLFLLNYSCHYASSEANCMSYIMLGWKRWLYTHDSKMEVETSLHLVNRQLHFSADGFFYVNLPLFHSITAVLATYLFILLQFD
ncbi:GSCOCT00004589001.3-RA-CDS, partial [Cotesia congregata]